MPSYRANAKILLAHESKTVEAGEEFDTELPQVKVDGKMVDMRLGDNITLLDAPAEAAPARRTPAGAAT